MSTIYPLFSSTMTALAENAMNGCWYMTGNMRLGYVFAADGNGRALFPQGKEFGRNSPVGLSTAAAEISRKGVEGLERMGADKKKR